MKENAIATFILSAIVLLCVGVSLFAPSTLALTRPPPSAWEYTFEDTNRIFFMTPTSWYGQIQIRSGLYYNTDPLVSIYYVDRVFHQSDVIFSKCGIYFAHLFNLFNPTTNHDVSSIFFFERGVLTRYYQRGEFLNVRYLPDYGIMSWERPNRRTIDRQNNELTIVTIQGNSFTFDITTGEVIYGTLFTDTEDSEAVCEALFAYAEDSEVVRRLSDTLLALMIIVAAVLISVVIKCILKKRSERKV